MNSFRRSTKTSLKNKLLKTKRFAMKMSLQIEKKLSQEEAITTIFLSGMHVF